MLMLNLHSLCHFFILFSIIYRYKGWYSGNRYFYLPNQTSPSVCNRDGAFLGPETV